MEQVIRKIIELFGLRNSQSDQMSWTRSADNNHSFKSHDDHIAGPFRKTFCFDFLCPKVLLNLGNSEIDLDNGLLLIGAFLRV